MDPYLLVLLLINLTLTLTLTVTLIEDIVSTSMGNLRHAKSPNPNPNLLLI
jgi:hypothetical protein